jgi:hypothetical protein
LKIDNLRRTKQDGRPGVAADISWEDCDRTPYTLYFETDADFADDLTCNPHAFLVGALPPAMHYGEKRIALNHEICPELYEGLVNAMQWVRRWFYPPKQDIVKIEAPISKKIEYRNKIDRAGLFFSGGIDAYSSFYGNRMRFAPEHPYAIKDGLLVYGLEIYDPIAFNYVYENLRQATGELGITLIPVYTNLYLEFREEDTLNDFSFWINELMGATFAAIAHAFSQRLSVVSIASNADIAHLSPWGSHPLLDTNYSSCDLKIRHDGANRTRFEKTQLISNQDVPLKYLRVCNLINTYTSDTQNCGVCAKCVKTKLALLALGALDKTTVFENNRIDPDLVKNSAYIYDDYTQSTYADLIDPLLEKGHPQLAEAVRLCLKRYAEKDSLLKKRLKQLNRSFFNGVCGKVISNLRNK